MPLSIRYSRRSLLLGSGAMIGTGALAAAGISGSAPPVAASDAGGEGLAALGARTRLPIGAFVSDSTLGDADFIAAVRRNCTLFAPMNELKRRVLEPAQGRFDFRRADRMVGWARRAGMRVHGHTLVWYKSDPAWLAPVLARTRSEALLTDHIARTMGRYRGQVASWDVVNEIIRPEDGRPDGLRDTVWLRAFGERYIDMAFHAARAADPDALLLLSDYGLETDHPVAEARRKAALGLLERLLKRGVPVAGVGFHAHFRRYGFPFDAAVLKPFLDRIRDLGLKMAVTEFDVADWNGPLSAEARDHDVADLTRRFADLMFSYDTLQSFTFFGLSDRYTWLNKERPALWLPKMRALPLDDDMQHKPMWDALADALRGRKSLTIARSLAEARYLT